MAITLLSNASATGASNALVQRTQGDYMGIYVRGTFSGATVTIQVSDDGTNWYPTDATFTAAGYKTIHVVAPYIRAAISGGTPSAMYCFALGATAKSAVSDS